MAGVGVFSKRAKVGSYALAYVGAADCYVLLGAEFYGRGTTLTRDEAFERARAAAQEALRRDATLAEAQATLGLLRFRDDWDWLEAERFLRRAIAMRPDYVPARHWYSDFLAAMGRSDQAILATKAVELDPASPLQNSQLGVRFLQGHLYDEAIEHLKEALRLDPNFPRARERLAMSYWLDGATVEAVESARRAPTPLGEFYELLSKGMQAEAVRVVATMSEHEWPGGLRASYHALAGDRVGALDVLDRAFRERHPLLPNALAFPPLDPLRTEPRLMEILRRMNLSS